MARIAAELGDAHAIASLGSAYKSGIDGAHQDYVLAHKWFNLLTYFDNSAYHISQRK